MATQFRIFILSIQSKSKACLIANLYYGLSIILPSVWWIVELRSRRAMTREMVAQRIPLGNAPAKLQ